MPVLLLVDGHSQAYRAYFALKTPLSTRAGEPTGAVFGFARKLLAALREVKPDYVAVAFDLGDTWRHAEFGDYKATRERMPDDMQTQMARIEQLLRAFNIPILTYANYEADDVLGALAKQAAARGDDVLIMTGDRDMFQLADERVKVYYTSGGPNPVTSVIGPQEVQARYGLTPQQFTDLKALVGDNSDNIPGVPGVGEKTAVKLLRQFGDLDGIYTNIDAVKGDKLRQALRDQRAQVELNRRLVTIVTELDGLTYDPEACRALDYDPAQVIALFNELEFRSMIKELPASDRFPGAEHPPASAAPAAAQPDDGQGQLNLFTFDNDEAAAPSGGVVAIPAAAGPVHGDYAAVQDAAALQRVVDALAAAGRFSFDVETTSTDAMRADLAGLGIAWAAGQAAYIPVGHSAGEQLPWEQVRDALLPFFADPAITKLTHNGKYDLTVCRRYGLDAAGPIHDTMVLAWLLDSGSRSLGLKAQAAAELGWEMTEIKALIGTGRKQITVDQVAIEAVTAYCCADVDATIRLFDILGARLRAAGMWQLYEEIELPLLPVLTDMEMAGVLLDVDYLHGMSQRLGVRLGELEQQLFQLVGHEFNLRSTQQMSQVLFGELKFPARNITKTASGHYSTAVFELEKLAAQSDKLSPEQMRVLDLIFEQRQLEKLRGTYVDALPALINPATGRVHTSFNQTGAVTGRMSSSDPNLQNIPVRTEVGREIRRAFIAPPGWLLISADYSQVELRIMAHVAQEETLIAAFNAGQDIHAATAATLFHIPLEEVTKAQRNLAKTINFATIYGSSGFALTARTEMTPGEARAFMDQYLATYPKIRTYIEETKQRAVTEGSVQTLLGRKRFFPELSNPRLPFNQRLALERQAINAPIQGTAADIVKIAMLKVDTALRAADLKSRMLLQVHDEIVLEIAPGERARVEEIVRHEMSGAVTLRAPLDVSVGVGPDWESAAH